MMSSMSGGEFSGGAMLFWRCEGQKDKISALELYKTLSHLRSHILGAGSGRRVKPGRHLYPETRKVARNMNPAVHKWLM